MMNTETETALWEWLLFNAGLKTYEAKQILVRIRENDLTLDGLRQMPVDNLKKLGFDAYANIFSQIPAVQHPTTAVRWDEPHYPSGLNELTLKMKPALLFTLGAQHLLNRPIVYFVPGDISPQVEELLQAIMEIILDTSTLAAVFTQSPQEKILLEQLAFSEGEALIFVDQGLDQWRPADEVINYIQDGRLIAVSPMPFDMQRNASLTPILRTIASAAARQWVVSSLNRETIENTSIRRRALLLETTPQLSQLLPNASIAVDIADAIHWLQDEAPVPSENLVEKNDGLHEEELAPLLPEQALHILESGGTVPDALRQRLMGK